MNGYPYEMAIIGHPPFPDRPTCATNVRTCDGTVECSDGTAAPGRARERVSQGKKKMKKLTTNKKDRNEMIKHYKTMKIEKYRNKVQ